MKHSQVKGQMMAQPLELTAQLRPRQATRKKTLVMSVSLTSLVDVFSILVIYLLVNSSAQTETLEIDKYLQLPKAKQANALQKATVVKVQNGQYIVEGQAVAPQYLAARLQQVQGANRKPGERPELIIQADRRLNFRQINPIIVASSQLGFTKIKFAVLHEVQ